MREREGEGERERERERERQRERERGRERERFKLPFLPTLFLDVKKSPRGHFLSFSKTVPLVGALIA